MDLVYTLHTFEVIDTLQNSFIEAGADRWEAHYKAQKIVETIGDRNILAWEHARHIYCPYDFKVTVTDFRGVETIF